MNVAFGARLGMRAAVLGIVIAFVLSVSTSTAGCGKRGAPQPPLRPIPGPAADVTARWIDDRIELRFTMPAANADGTTPSVVERAEVYGVASPATATPPTLAQIADPKNLKTRIAVRRPDPDPAPASPSQPPSQTTDGIAPGEQATYIDNIGHLLGAPPAAGAPLLRYVIVTVSGRRRTTSPVIPMPLVDRPAAPLGLAFVTDERQVTLTWQPGAPGYVFRVYDVNAAGQVQDAAPPAGAPLTEPRFTTAVEFDKPRCFTVRAVRVAGAAFAEGPAAQPECVTPKDTFPPVAPTGLFGAPADGAVTLTWDPVNAPDLAGYLVLRGEGANAKLQPLTKAPLTVTTYRDAAVKAGVTYVYAVIALDKASNASGESKREIVTAR